MRSLSSSTRLGYLVLCGASVAMLSTASAADLRLRRKPQSSAAAAAPLTQPGHITYIQRLIRDANAAAGRGDMAGARRLAERANKVAVLYQSAPTSSPDCTPEATAELARKFGSRLGSPATSSSAAPSTPPPAKTVKSSLAPELDLLSMVDPKFRKPLPERPDATRENRIVNSSSSRTILSSSSDKQQRRDQDHTVSASSRRTEPAAAGELAASTQVRTKSPIPVRSVSSPARLSAQHSTRSLNASAPVRSEAEPIIDPELRSAIGAGDDEAWELDLDGAEEFNAGPPASLESPLPPAPPVSDDTQARTVPAPAGTKLGVWSSGDEAIYAAATTQRAVSLPDFLGPKVSPASRHVESPSHNNRPALIETDFHRPNRPVPPRLVRDEPAAPRLAAATGSAIRVQEGAAVEWPEISETSAAAKIAKAESLPLGLAWPKSMGERLALATGIALLVGGLVLFGLSFRWT